MANAMKQANLTRVHSMIKSTTLFFILSMSAASSVWSGQVEIDQIEAATSPLNVAELKALSKGLSGYEQALSYVRLALSASLRGQADLVLSSAETATDLLKALHGQLSDQTTANQVEVLALLAMFTVFALHSSR